MQPASFNADFLLVKIKNAKSTRLAVLLGEEHRLLSQTAAGNQAYASAPKKLKTEKAHVVDWRQLEAHLAMNAKEHTQNGE